MTQRILVVLGAGPGLGLAVARRFAAEGYLPVLATRDLADGALLVATLADEGRRADAVAVTLTDPDDIATVMGVVGKRHGRIDVLHFNPSIWREKDPLHLSLDELLEDVAAGAGALLPAVQAVLPFMPDDGRVLVTGSAAADTPWQGAASLGVQKAALRNLVTSLDATLKETGRRAVALQINGVLSKEGRFSPEPIADAMWRAVQRPAADWTPHVPYDG